MDNNIRYIFEMLVSDKESVSKQVKNEEINFVLLKNDLKKNKKSTDILIEIDENLRTIISQIAKVEGTTYEYEKRKFKEVERMIKSYGFESVQLGYRSGNDSGITVLCRVRDDLLEFVEKFKSEDSKCEELKVAVKALLLLGRQLYGKSTVWFLKIE